MMTQDPFQTYQTSYSGGVTPFGLPLTTPFQSSYNPFTGPVAPGGQQIGLHANPFAGAGFGSPLHALAQLAQNPYAIYTNPLLAMALQQPQPYGGNPLINPIHAGLQNPGFQNQGFQHPGFQSPGLQNPGLPNPGLQSPWTHPFAAAGLHNPIAGHAWTQPQYPPIGYPLAPQTLIGSAGIGQGYGPFQPYGAVNPLAQAAYRQAGGFGWF